MRDNGPGISSEDQRKLFKPFSKLKANKELNPNGNGLGLNICKLICKNLGGDIDVESDGTSWTQFKFWVQVETVDKISNKHDLNDTEYDLGELMSSRAQIEIFDTS